MASFETMLNGVTELDDTVADEKRELVRPGLGKPLRLADICQNIQYQTSAGSTVSRVRRDTPYFSKM